LAVLRARPCFAGVFVMPAMLVPLAQLAKAGMMPVSDAKTTIRIITNDASVTIGYHSAAATWSRAR
jgi:hypothetical protein